MTKRHWAYLGGGIGVVLVLMIIGLAAFPYGALRSTIEQRLSARFGRPVTVGSVVRIDRFGFTPTLAVRDLRVPQAPWAGAGELARVKAVTVQFRAWPLLLGKFRPTAVTVAGARLVLVRRADGRTNWENPDAAHAEEKSGGGGFDLSRVTVSDTIVDYRDAKRKRTAILAIVADPNGVRASGRGTVRGSPVTIALSGPAVRGGAWPVTARIAGPMLTIDARGTMDRALDPGRMTLSVDARADDLRYIDAVVEAGLTGTQPVRLTARARHDGPRWVVTGPRGTIGASDIAGRVSVDKSSGRNVIDGEVTADRLDFADLASDESLAAAAALEAAIGPRVVPKTPINLKNFRKTDGRLAFRARHVFSRFGPSSITALAGVVTIDHQRLTVSTVRIGLRQSAIEGNMTVDQRGGVPVPLVTIDLRLRNSTIGSLTSGAAQVGGRVDGHARLVGRGNTIRAAVGNSNGQIGFAARGGAVPERIAAALGFDVGRALLAGKDDRAALRCIIANIAVRGGRGTVDPIVIDTSQSQAHGAGTLTFPGETLALRLTGAPKQGSVLRVPGVMTVGGRLQAPSIGVTKETKSAGNILKAIGRAIVGGNGPKATDANCDALAARALR